MRAFFWLLLAAPLLELWFIIKVGSALGALTTIALLLLAGVAGVALLRHQSFSTLLRLDQRLQQGELPAAEILEGFALALAAVLLLVPGFLSDILALPLLLSPVRRALVRRALGTGYYRQHYGQPGRHNHPDIIEGEWRRDDDPRLP